LPHSAQPSWAAQPTNPLPFSTEFIGVAPVLAKKKILCPCVVFILTLVAAIGAAYLGIHKPF
jgi:hypothetical protein